MPAKTVALARGEIAIALMRPPSGAAELEHLAPALSEVAAPIEKLAAEPDRVGRRIVRERRDEQEIALRAEAARDDWIESRSRLENRDTAVDRADDIRPLGFHQPGAGLRWMYRAEPAVAAKCQLPPLRSCRVGTEQRAVVLSAPEILRAVGKWRAVIELRHAIAVIQRLSMRPGSAGLRRMGQADPSTSPRAHSCSGRCRRRYRSARPDCFRRRTADGR